MEVTMTASDPDQDASASEDRGKDTIITSALGDSARVKILSVFLGDYDRDLNATQIAQKAGVDRATFYRHIEDLRAWGLVEQTREVGQSKMYQINEDSEAAKKLAEFEWELMKFLAEKESAGEIDEDNEPILSDA